MTESQDERAPSRAERTTSRVYGWDEVLFLKPTAEQQREEGKEILGKISWGMQGLCFLLRQANYMCGVSDSRANTARPDVRGGDQMWQSQTDRSTNCDKKCEWRKSESKRPEVFFYLEGEKMARVFLIIILSNWWMCYCCLERKATIRLPDLSAPQQRPLKSNTQHAKLPWPFCYFI